MNHHVQVGDFLGRIVHGLVLLYNTNDMWYDNKLPLRSLAADINMHTPMPCIRTEEDWGVVQMYNAFENVSVSGFSLGIKVECCDSTVNDGTA